MDISFYLIAVPAVIITGLSKGGFGGGIAMLGTPMLALLVSPVQAAAIMLPVLLMMDAIGVWNYRSIFDRSILKSMLPAAMVGIFLGWLMAARVSDDWIRILVGLVAVIFAINQWSRDLYRPRIQQPNRYAAAFWGTITGFTSFISHAGGPPFQAYVLPLKLDKILFAGTGVVAFACINSAKVIPYFALDQFTADNLWISMTLLPVAWLGVFLGIWLVKRISQELFYRISYIAMIMVGCKLLWDGRQAFYLLIRP